LEEKNTKRGAQRGDTTSTNLLQGQHLGLGGKGWVEGWERPTGVLIEVSRELGRPRCWRKSLESLGLKGEVNTGLIATGFRDLHERTEREERSAT